MTGLIGRREVLGGIAAAGAVTNMRSDLIGPAQAATVPEAIISASAGELAEAIRTKRMSSQEIVAAHLDRIAAVNPKLNAVVQVTADAARKDAAEADAALARGEIKGPLHGVPVTIKDTLETAGVICTGGTKGRAN
ncbi:MAG: amidase, partial [Methylobacteriaceae bacterium]|nr:amidase [Methylobacteriaceae bacterium]